MTISPAAVRLDYVCGRTRWGTIGDGHMHRRDGDPATAPYVIDCPHCGRPAEIVQRSKLDDARRALSPHDPDTQETKDE